jgi:hypothetical protein
MPITPYVAGQAFEPDVIREMSVALQTACEKLELKLTDDPATRLVASKVIELAHEARGMKTSKHYEGQKS